MSSREYLAIDVAGSIRSGRVVEVLLFASRRCELHRPWVAAPRRLTSVDIGRARRASHTDLPLYFI
jgi:hypothetical protein